MLITFQKPCEQIGSTKKTYEWVPRVHVGPLIKWTDKQQYITLIRRKVQLKVIVCFQQTYPKCAPQEAIPIDVWKLCFYVDHFSCLRPNHLFKDLIMSHFLLKNKRKKGPVPEAQNRKFKIKTPTINWFEMLTFKRRHKLQNKSTNFNCIMTQI